MPPASRPPGGSDADALAALRLVEALGRAMEQRDRAAIIDIVRRLVAMRAPMGDQWRALAHLVFDHGEMGLAREAIDLFVEDAGGAPFALYEKMALLERSGALGEAYALVDALPPDFPTPAANACSRGTAALYLGDMGEARAQLERAVHLEPQVGSAWLSLAMAVDLAEEPALRDRIIAAGPHFAHAPPQQRAPYLYALGKAYADSGDHARAFAAFAEGGRTMKTIVRYDRAADRRNAEEASSGYAAARIAAIAAQQTEPTERALFVTGTPRSGTTLVEQILVSHSAVGGGGEINRLPLLAREVGGASHAALDQYRQRHGVAQAARLWDHWLAQRCPPPGRVVDKSIGTSRYAGLAASLLPEAPLVWLTRDPLDRAWSCFRTFFIEGTPWSFDLEDIAFFFWLEAKLLHTWRDLLGDRLLVVPYEDLVTDSATWTRRILAHCGLAEEPQVFAPHRTVRTVATASVTQVRAPINAKAVGAAEPYRAFLAPFIDAFYA